MGGLYAKAVYAANVCRAEPLAGKAEAEGSRKAQKTEPGQPSRPKSPQAGQGRAAGKGASRRTKGPQKRAAREPASRHKERPDTFKANTASLLCNLAISLPQHPRLFQETDSLSLSLILQQLREGRETATRGPPAWLVVSSKQ